jgi:hypothetical protein
MESKWGKEGVRQFLFALRKAVIGGGDDAFEEAFKIKGDEFDQQFERYLKERFKPFRDKERPADYGRNLAPNPKRARSAKAMSGRTIAFGRPDRGGDRQSQRRRTGYRAPLRKGRRGHPQPDQRFRSEQGMGVPICAARRPLHPRALDVMGHQTAIALPTSSGARKRARSSFKTC